MSSHRATIERSNRKNLKHVEVQITMKESTTELQSWYGEFTSPSTDGILPDERLALILENGQRGMARVTETRFDSRSPRVTTVHFAGMSPLT